MSKTDIEKIIFFIFFSLLFIHFAFAQPVIQWEKNYGGSLTELSSSIIQSSDGGFIVSSFSLSNDFDVSKNFGAQDIWIFKTDAMGKIEWEISLGGSEPEGASEIVATNDGGLLIIGKSRSNLDGSNMGENDAWVFKLDMMGKLEWSKNYGGSRDDFIRSVCKIDNGNFLLIGETFSNDGDIIENKGLWDCWLFEIDSQGALLWSKTFGGSEMDWGYFGISTDDGGYMVLGMSNSADGDVPENRGRDDLWVFKLNANQDMVWSRVYGGSKNDWPTQLLKTADNNILVYGGTESNDGDIFNLNKGKFDIWLLKIDLNGEIIWNKTYGGSESDFALGGILDAAGGKHIVLGTSFSDDRDVSVNYGNISLPDYWLFSIDETGDILWEKSYGGSGGDAAQDIIRTNDGGFALVGCSNSDDIDVSGNYGRDDIWLVKLAPEDIGIRDSCTFSLFPNPISSSELHLHFDQLIPENELNIEIFDLGGRLVWKDFGGENDRFQKTIHLPSSFAPGVYFLRAECNNSAFLSKFIKVD